MDTDYYIDYYDLERTHWWFTARIDILESTLKKRIIYKENKSSTLKILNVGVATGATTEMLSKFGEVTSLEYDKQCCEFLLNKTGIKAVNASVNDMPFPTETYDLICAFDVIEHVEHDLQALNEIKRVLKKDGTIFTTVPAFSFLWGDHDEVNHHYRRYTLQNYKSLFSKNKLETSYTNYFNFWLFIPIAIVRVLTNLISQNPDSSRAKITDNEGLNSNKFIGILLKMIFKSEKHLLGTGIRLPFGVSIIHIGKKQE